MNIKLRSFFTVSCFLITFQFATAQDKTNGWPPQKWPHNTKNCHHLLSNTYQCNWQFFEIKGILEGTLVAYNTASGDKEGLTSVAIIKTGNETMRIIFLSNAVHKPGERIKIVAAKEPEMDVLCPFDRDYYITEERKGNKPGCRVNEYDATVLKTAWGTVVM